MKSNVAVLAEPAAAMSAPEVITGLSALAHETRLAIFRLLVRRGADGERAGELARLLEVPPQTMSFHLKELTHAGLLSSRRHGRNTFYAVDFVHAQRLIGYLTESCCADAAPSTASRRRNQSG